ncbi:heavy metal translocating P-type ATPase [Halomontanus rarus]|uniref:heavy metal translocating P-type ATPase n=1 Tax=Halomontanus rarus TaxID=3034020 RepID=UPI001A9A2487
MSDSSPSEPPEEQDSMRRRTIELRVPEMDCPSCAGKVTNSVETLDGIETIDPQVTTGKLFVEYDPELVDDEDVRERVRAAGYAIESENDGEDGTATLEFAVPEMDCSSCAGKVENALEGLSDIDSIDTQPTTGRVTVTTPENAVDPRTIVTAIESAGYEATPIDDGTGSDRFGAPEPAWRSRRGVVTIAGGALVTVGMVLQFLLPTFDPQAFVIAERSFHLSHLLFLAAVAVAGTPILRNGYYSARNRSLDIDFLMSAGIIGSVLTHHPFEGAMLAVLFSVAELLERYSMDRARDSLRELMDLSPETATVQRDGEEVTIPVDAVDVGDTVIVRPGEKVPTDGIVREGSSTIDQAPITGESVPVEKGRGAEVYGGSINEAGYLEIEVTSELGESTIAKIVELVEDAQREQTDREQFVERFASVYTPVVVALAIAVAVGPPLLTGASWNTWFLRGLTLLVIACPCAFVISTPVSVVSGITSAARNGVLVKGGRHLEAVGEGDVLAIDKTGTLTTGELSVTDVIALEGADEDDVLRRAGAIERRSEHPIAEAIVDRADERGVGGDDEEVTDFEALPGEGVRAKIDGVTHYAGKPNLFDDLANLEHTHVTDGGQVQALDGAEARRQCERDDCIDLLREVVPDLESQGKTVIVVGTDERLLGLVAIADEVRPESAWAVSRLQEQGVRTVMLTGDNEGTARAIAGEVGIEEYHAELLPEEKLEWIRRLDDEHGQVAMVGDGINDAPALATATVGIAMGTAGTDTALETADIALMGDDLTRLPYLFRLSRTANGVIRQNIWASLGVKAVLAAGAPFGVVTVIHAVVIGDMGMSLGVTGNAMRLSRIEPELPESESEFESGPGFEPESNT